LSAESIGWHDEQDEGERRRVRRAMSISIAVHVVLFAALVISPPVSFEPMPQSIAVELIAGPELAAPAAPRPAARRRAPPPPPAPEPPAEEAAPEPPPTPAPPMPKAPVQVLPENEPQPQKKVEQPPEKKPKEVAKAESKPKTPAKEPVKKAEQQPEESLSLDDAMKSLNEELGEDETTDLLAPAPSRPADRPVAESGGAAESRAGASVNPQDAAWGLAMRRRIQSKWVTLSQYQGRGLVTVLALELTAAGELIGDPEVVRTSGDPFFDDHAVQGVLMAKPLPVPPRAGRLILIFPSEEN